MSDEDIAGRASVVVSSWTGASIAIAAFLFGCIAQHLSEPPQEKQSGHGDILCNPATGKFDVERTTILGASVTCGDLSINADGASINLKTPSRLSDAWISSHLGDP